MTDYRTPRESVRGLSRTDWDSVGDRIIGYACIAILGFILGMLTAGY
jgi:hypothetical protein